MVTQEEMLDFYQNQPTQHFKKFGNFQFEIAETEHQVVTQLATDTVPETTKTAQVGDFILTGTQGERYVVNPKTFENRYIILEYNEDENLGTAKATGECDAFEFEGEDFEFQSPWGDKMICNEGDFLVINREKPEIYRIQRQAFFDTYQLAS